MDACQCTYCQSAITSLRFKCAECPDFTVCVQVCRLQNSQLLLIIRWLGSRVVSVLDSGAEGPHRSRDAVG